MHLKVSSTKVDTYDCCCHFYLLFVTMYTKVFEVHLFYIVHTPTVSLCAGTSAGRIKGRILTQLPSADVSSLEIHMHDIQQPETGSTLL